MKPQKPMVRLIEGHVLSTICSAAYCWSLMFLNLSIPFVYAVVMVMYLPISSVAYFIYGKNVQSNILLTKSRDVDNKEVSDVINQVVEVLITIHLILGLLIVINPFCQELESYARVPRRKSWLLYATPYRTLTVI